MNVEKKVRGVIYDREKMIVTYLNVRIRVNKIEKTLSLVDESKLTGVEMSIPLEAIEKELREVLK